MARAASSGVDVRRLVRSRVRLREARMVGFCDCLNKIYGRTGGANNENWICTIDLTANLLPAERLCPGRNAAG